MLLVAVAIVLIGQGTAEAVTKTWTGTTAAAWNTPARWSPTGTPVAGDDVVLGTTATVTVGAAVTGLNSITISAGTLTANASIGATTLTVSGGTVNGSSAITVTNLTVSSGSFTMGSNVTATNITASGGTLTNSTTHTVSNATLSGGTLTLTNALTVNGTLSVTSGSYTMNANLVTSGTTNITASGGTLTVSTAHTVGNVTLSGGTLTLSNTLTVGGTFSLTTGTFTMNANLVTSATSSITASGGTLTVSTAHTVGSVTVSGGTLTVNNTLTVSGGSVSVTAGTLNGSGTVSAPTLTFSGGTGTFSGTVTINVPSITVSSGTLTVSANIDATTITVSGGTLTVSAAQSGIANVTVSGGAFTANANVTLTGTFSVSSGSFTGTGTVTAPTVAYSGGTFTGNVSATTLTVSGGTLTAGSNITATNITVSGGTLTVTPARSVTNLTVSGGTLTANANVTVTGTFSFTSGTVNGTSTVAATALTFTGGTVTGSATVTGPGISIATGTAITVSSGTFSVGANITAGSITVSGGTVTVTSASATVGSVTVSGGTYVTSANATLTGAFSVSSGSVTLNASLSAASISVSGGTVTVSGSTATVTTTGAFTVSGGTFTGGSATTNTINVGGNLTISNATTDPSLEAHWKLDETTIGTAADSSGNGYTLTHVWGSGTGPTSSLSVPTVGFSDPRSLKMVTANRDAARVTMPSGLQLPLPLTISAWYRATNMGTNAGEIASGTDSYVLRLSRATSSIDVVKRTSASAWTTLSTTAANYLDGNWHQVVGVFNTTGMTVYYDGVAVGSNTDTAAISYSSIDYFAIGRNGGTNALCDFDGNIDDVRVYSRALSAAEITALSAGRTAGTLVLSGPLSVTGSLTVQSTGTLTLSGANAAITMANNQTFTMDGTLNASTSASTGPSIQTSGLPNTFHFYVGSTNGATPTLNISSLAVKNTDLNGMRINGNGSGTTTATTAFTQFDNVAFSNGTPSSSSGVAYLQIYSSTLYLVSHGCSFGAGEADSARPAVAVKLTGNGYTNGATETRALFGGTTCAGNWTGGGTDKTCLTTAKSDNDTGVTAGTTANDGIGDVPASDGAVVQFVRAAESDTNGTIEGFPTAAFNWTGFVYYSTYVAYHDADESGTKDRVYVRQTDGTAAASTYYWEAPAGETIVGTPRWDTVGSVHYVYVALASGKVYQLVDNTTAHTLSTTGAAWTTNPFLATSTPSATSATITTPLSKDATNLYFGGTSTSGTTTTNYVWSVRLTTGAGASFAVSAGAVTSAAPAVWTSGSDTYVTVGLNSQITSIDITNYVSTFSNTSPVGSVVGRIGYGAKTAATLFVSDNQGNMLGISPTVTTNTARWSFPTSSTTVSASYYDFTGDTLMFGTAGGKLYTLLTATGTSVTSMSGFASGYAPNSNTAAFSNAPLYFNGILLAGTIGGATTGGKLYIIDRDTCNSGGPSLVRQYSFGANVSVSGIGYDSSSSRYMVTTSSSISDGSLYYIDSVTDPTPTCL